MKCVDCEKEIEYGAELMDGENAFCGDCALNFMVKSHGIPEREAIYILERRQFSNGIRG